MTNEERHIAVLNRMLENMDVYDSIQPTTERKKAIKAAIKALEKEPCDDVVSREAVIDTLDDMDNVLDEGRTIENYKELLKECYEVLPPVNPQEPKTGHWIVWDTSSYDWTYKCDKCGSIALRQSNYCPNCGVKMESEDKE